MPKIKATKNVKATSIEETARTFGLHVAAMRRSRGMTLDKLADATGLNKGHLSRLERSEKAPSIASVLKIAQAFAVPVSTLFGETVDEALIHVVRAQEREPRAPMKDEARFQPLSRGIPSASLEAFLLFPGLEFGADGRVDHGGTEVIFVTSGEIEVQFADRAISLKMGDFLQFPGHLAHQVRALREGASALVAVTRER